MFAGLLGSIIPHSMTCSMVKVGAAHMKSRCQIVKSSMRDSKLALSDSDRTSIVDEFTAAATNVPAHLRYASSRYATSTATEIASDKEAARSVIDKEATQPSEDSTSPAADDTMGVQENTSDETATSSRVKSELNQSTPKHKRSKFDNDNSDIASHTLFIALQRKYDESESSKRILETRVAMDKITIAKLRASDSDMFKQNLELQRKQSIYNASTPSEAYTEDALPLTDDILASRPPPPPAPLLDQFVEPSSDPQLWLDDLIELESDSQGDLGVVGTATMSIRPAVAAASAEASSPKSAKRKQLSAPVHHVLYKKSFVLLSSTDSHYMERSVMEIIKRHPHPNVHGVFGLAKTREKTKGRDKMYHQVGIAFAIELIHGVSLLDLLSANSNLTHSDPIAVKRTSAEQEMLNTVTLDDPVAIMKMMLQVVKGVKHLHDHGIVHRDIHLANIMVTGPGLSAFSRHKSFIQASRDDEDEHRYRLIDGFSSHPVVSLHHHILDGELLTHSERPMRLSLIDMNNALPLYYAIRSNSGELDELVAGWDGGASDYSQHTYLARNNEVSGWEQNSSMEDLAEYWIGRDNFSLALVITDIMRGCPMNVKCDDKSTINQSLLHAFFTYCSARLSPSFINNGVQLPSLCEYLSKETLDKNHWLHPSFVARSKTMSATMGQQRFKPIKDLLFQMTTNRWQIAHDNNEQHKDAVSAAIVIHGNRKPSVMLADLDLAINACIAFEETISVDFDQLLTSKLAAKGLKSVIMPSDGDCLYHSIVHQMRNHVGHVSLCSWSTPGSTFVNFQDTAKASVRQMRKNIHAHVKKLYDAQAWDDERAANDAMSDAGSVDVMVEQAWIEEGRSTDQKGRKKHLHDLKTCGIWNNSHGDNVLSTISMYYKVHLVVISAAAETIDQPDQPIGLKDWPTLTVLRSKGHFDGTIAL